MNTRRLARSAPAAPVAAPVQAADPGYRELAFFMAPLLFTGFMMTTDTPFANAALARLPNAQEALAALTVAFALALVYESPHIMMIEAGTTLATDHHSLGVLRRFYGWMALIVGLIGATVVFSPIYTALVEGIMNIPPALAAAVRPTIAVFLLWPLPIGWRRLHQGALIRRGFSRAVGAGTIVRTIVLVVALLGLVPLLGGTVGGSTLAAMAMVASVTGEAAYTHWQAGRLLADLPAAAPAGRDLTPKKLWTFFWPLAGTSLLSTINRPILSAGLATAATLAAGPASADAALAAWGVAFGLLFLVNGATLTLGQVAIAWDAHPQAAVRRRGDRLIVGAGLALSALVALAALTPVAGWLLDTIYSVTPAVRQAALTVLVLLAPVPFFFATNGLLRGKLISRRRTHYVQRTQVINLFVMLTVLGIGIYGLDAAHRPAATALGAVASLIVYTSDLLVLGWGVRTHPRPEAHA